MACTNSTFDSMLEVKKALEVKPVELRPSLCTKRKSLPNARKRAICAAAERQQSLQYTPEEVRAKLLRKDSFAVDAAPPPRKIVVLRLPPRDPRALLRASRKNLDAAIWERQQANVRLQHILQHRSNLARTRDWARLMDGRNSASALEAAIKVRETEAEAIVARDAYGVTRAIERRVGPALNRLAREVELLEEAEGGKQAGRGKGA